MSIRVFIVDDSAVVRKVLTEMLNGVSGIDVIGAAQDPIFAQSKMEQDWPDVIILDVEMPRMDGITFLKKIMSERPTPVVMCSTLTQEGSKTSLQALSIGAIDVVAKPRANVKNALPEASSELVSAIRTAAKANMSGAKLKPIVKGTGRNIKKTGSLIAIGASTGGTQALEALLSALPANTLPILVVQHMPEKFTHAFAKRLNELCKVDVKEAEDNDALVPGRVLIAPGSMHMMSRHRPSVDVLFRSVSKFAGSNAMGIILTGMGDDGAKGLKEMHDAGANTIAQNKETCVVYGMPNEAVKLGAIDHELALENIPAMIVEHR